MIRTTESHVTYFMGSVINHTPFRIIRQIVCVCVSKFIASSQHERCKKDTCRIWRMTISKNSNLVAVRGFGKIMHALRQGGDWGGQGGGKGGWAVKRVKTK